MTSFALIALFSWPVVAVLLFQRLPLKRAIIWTILGGYLLLPEGVGIDLPLLPAFNKSFIPAASALLLCLTRLRSPLELLPKGRLPRILTLVFLLSPFVTVAMNSAPVLFGPTVIPGLQPYDAFSTGLSRAVMLVPFLLGQRFLRDEAALRDLLTAFAVAGLAYSLPVLFEARMSPQLHNWIYGFYQHSFAQQKRFDGFRPMVFLPHGIWVALFMSMTLLSAAALWKGHQGDRKRHWGLATGWLTIAVIVCKTVSAWFYATLLLPLIVFAGRRLQRLALLGIATMVLLYPILRGADLVPTQAMVSLAGTISEDRAGSLRYRFDNEDILLERANLQPLFGWGGWGRNRVYDPTTGQDISTTDGAWILTIGQYGWVGYLAEYGLLTWSLIVLGTMRFGRQAPFAAIALGLVLSANLLDLLPNAGRTPVTWLLAGSLVGVIAEQRSSGAARRGGAFRPRLAPGRRPPAWTAPPTQPHPCKGPCTPRHGGASHDRRPVSRRGPPRGPDPHRRLAGRGAGPAQRLRNQLPRRERGRDAGSGLRRGWLSEDDPPRPRQRARTPPVRLSVTHKSHIFSC